MAGRRGKFGLLGKAGPSQELFSFRDGTALGRKSDKPKLLIVGLSISELPAEPLSKLRGNTVRSFALFEYLQDFGFETFLYIGSKCRTSESTLARVRGRLVLNEPNTKDLSSYDGIVLVGTRVQETLEQNAWLTKPFSRPIFQAMCYHNVKQGVPDHIVVNTRIACYVSPVFTKYAAEVYSDCLFGTIETGQTKSATLSFEPSASRLATSSGLIFKGIMHHISRTRLLVEIAHHLPQFSVTLISRKMKGEDGNYRQISDEVQFHEFIREHKIHLPDNFHFALVDEADEGDLMANQSIAIDFSWSKSWRIDNSKVANYLTYGLPVVCEEYSPSSRFLQRLAAGALVAHGASAQEWAKVISEMAEDLSMPGYRGARRALAEKSQTLFSWTETTYDFASYLQAYFLEKAMGPAQRELL